MDRKMMIAVGVAVLVGAGVLVYGVWFRGNNDGGPQALNEYKFKCTQCGTEFLLPTEEATAQEESGGITCPNGHQGRSVPMLKCAQCGEWFAQPGGGRAPVCPHCGYSPFGQPQSPPQQ